jgi:hypothetical protein
VARIDAGLSPRRPVPDVTVRERPIPSMDRLETSGSQFSPQAPMPKWTAAPSSRGAGPALPFASGPAPAPRQSTGTKYLPEDSPEKGGTIAPGYSPGGPATPFRGAAQLVRAEEVDLSMFPLERYAEVVRALAAQEPRDAVLRRFVLTEEMWNALARAWAKRMSTDPELQRSFSALVQRAQGSR